MICITTSALVEICIERESSLCSVAFKFLIFRRLYLVNHRIAHTYKNSCSQRYGLGGLTVVVILLVCHTCTAVPPMISRIPELPVTVRWRRYMSERRLSLLTTVNFFINDGIASTISNEKDARTKIRRDSDFHSD